MAELEADGTLLTARGLAEAVVFPLAEQLGTESGRHYLRILADMSTWDPVRALSVTDISANESLMRCGDLIDEVLAHQPARVRGLRRQVLFRIVLRALGDQAQWEISPEADALYVGNLIDLAESALVAPVSEATESLLGDGDR
jgi:hypothetical protein